MSDLILLGTAPSRKLCPFDTETWGVNGSYTSRGSVEKEGKKFRMEKLFITDHTFSPEGTLHFDITAMNKLGRDYGTEFISLRPIGFGKYQLKSKPYPWDEIVAKFKTTYFSSTICYMLAYALYENRFEKISLYGIDMSSQKEYWFQKGGVEYWLGRAHERGIETFISEGSVLLKAPSYAPYGHDAKIDYKKVDPYNLLGMH